MGKLNGEESKTIKLTEVGLIKSKERVLKHQYNRREYRQGAFEMILKDTKATVGFDPVMGYYKQSGATIIGMDYAEQSNIATIVMGSADVTVMGFAEATVCPPHRIFNLDEFIKEEPEIYQQLCETGFNDVPIWTFYEYLRAYHVIEIIIGFLITLGVYVWLK